MVLTYFRRKMMKKFTYKNEQTGRSMVEMLGVLAIVGVLSVGGITGYTKAMAKFKIGKTQDQIMNVINNVRSLYGTESSYDGLSDDTMIAANIAPKDMIRGTILVNAFGGQVAVAPAGTAGNNEGFVVELNHLPSEVCIALSTSDWGSAATGLDAVEVTSGVTGAVTDGTFIATPATSAAAVGGLVGTWATGAAEPLPISIASATTACSDPTKNSLAIYYR